MTCIITPLRCNNAKEQCQRAMFLTMEYLLLLTGLFVLDGGDSFLWRKIIKETLKCPKAEHDCWLYCMSQKEPGPGWCVFKKCICWKDAFKGKTPPSGKQ